MENSTNPTVSTIVRTVLVVLALANQVLTIFGKSIIPVSDDQVQLAVSTACTVITALIAWWKNNSFTKKAIAADATFKTK